MAVEAVDTHLCETAVLTIILYSYAGLETKAVGERAGVDHIEKLVGDNAYEYRTVAALGLAFRAGDNHLVKQESVRGNLKIHFACGAGIDRHCLFF